MEFQFSSGSFFIISAFFVFIFMLLKICRGYKTSNSIPKLPPGPWKLPIIGHMHHLVGSLTHNIYGPLMHLQRGEVSTVVSTPEAAKEIMRTHDNIFAFRTLLLAPDIISYGGAGISFAPYGDYWRQMRKICGSVLLNLKRVESFQSIRDEEVSHLLEFIGVNIGLPINLGEQIFSMTCIWDDYDDCLRSFTQRNPEKPFGPLPLSLSEPPPQIQSQPEITAFRASLAYGSSTSASRTFSFSNVAGFSASESLGFWLLHASERKQSRNMPRTTTLDELGLIKVTEARILARNKMAQGTRLLRCIKEGSCMF